MSLTAIAVTGTYKLEDGTACSGQVEFTLTTAMQDTVGRKIVPSSTIIVPLDGTGSFTKTLYANDDASTSPAGVAYTVVERITGASTTRTYQVVLPSSSPGGTVDLASLAPALPSNPLYGYLLASTANATYAAKTPLRRYVPPVTALTRLRSTGTPGVTVSAANAATTISNPVTTGMDQTAYIRESGAPGPMGFANGGYYGNPIDGSDYPATQFETVLYGRYCEWIIDSGRAVRVFVDEVPTTDLALFIPTAAGDYRVIVDCGTVGAHHVRFMCDGIVKGITYDGTNGTIYAPETPVLLRDYYLGDSWTQGYGADGATSTAHSPAGLGAYCADLLGSTPIVGGESGTGYTNNAGGGSGQTTFPQRVPALVVPAAPDRVIVIGSVNDIGASAAAVQAAATSTFAALASGLPNTDVYVFGVQYVPANVGNTIYNAIDDAIKAAALAASNVKKFTSMRGWGIPAAFVRQDGIHLASAGYKYVGTRMAQVIAGATQTTALG